MIVDVKPTKRARKPDLDKVYVRDFGDYYHKSVHDPDDTLMYEVTTLRRRYKDYHKYQAGVLIFNDYIHRLIEKYGGWERFKIMAETDQIHEYLPPIPQMKDTKRNRKLLKEGVKLSISDIREINEDLINEIIQLLDRIDPASIKFASAFAKQKKVQEIVSKFKNITRDDTVKDVSKITDINILRQYYADKRVSTDNSLEDIMLNLSVMELLNGHYDDIFADTEDEEATVNHNGVAVSRTEREQMQIVNMFGDVGWDTVKITKLIRNKRLLTISKETRAREKNAKKSKKKADAFLTRIFEESTGGASYGDFENDILDMTTKNLFGRN